MSVLGEPIFMRHCFYRYVILLQNFIKAKRYFIGEPVWTPHNRPADDMECRKLYLQKLSRGF